MQVRDENERLSRQIRLNLFWNASTITSFSYLQFSSQASAIKAEGGVDQGWRCTGIIFRAFEEGRFTCVF